MSHSTKKIKLLSTFLFRLWSTDERVKLDVHVCAEVMEKDDVALIANFTFVARDWKTQKAAPVNYLVPQTEDEKQLFALGAARDAHRKKLRMESSAGASSLFSKQYNDRLTQVLREV
jgi:acyl-coenzyme A thioesterase 9